MEDPKFCSPINNLIRDLIDMKEELMTKLNDSTDLEKQKDIKNDMSDIDQFIIQVGIIETGLNKISKKYGWDK